MNIKDALKDVLSNALCHDGLARGLREAVKALDKLVPIRTILVFAFPAFARFILSVVWVGGCGCVSVHSYVCIVYVHAYIHVTVCVHKIACRGVALCDVAWIVHVYVCKRACSLCFSSFFLLFYLFTSCKLPLSSCLS